MTKQAEEYLITMLCDEADAERMGEMEEDEIDEEWVDYQLHRIFCDYRSDYRQSTPPKIWREFAAWESSDMIFLSVSKLTAKVQEQWNG